ncbi:MAG TPA: hypothetical protein VKX45_21130 [Bryobacteraceae bacterium]|jgi:hypothetical protein|nr:hypothetical protein [Bryobacteraceae bacterium]
MQRKNCKVCLVEHDEEIHAATLRLRAWLRERFREPMPEPVSEEAAASAA